MGVDRLSAGQSVQALDEAIEVIRQVWDVESPGGARVDGDFYRVAGAKRGPAAAHDISIWLGAYKPRMLALAGRSADGWLPSMTYLQPGELAAGNAIIDDAAAQAGRPPDAVRSLLNVSGRFSAASRGPLHGPPEQWTEELADLALTDGFSTFILATDDSEDLLRFAGEVTPGVREMVEAERAVAPAASSATRTTKSGQHTPRTPVGLAALDLLGHADPGRRAAPQHHTASDLSTHPRVPAIAAGRAFPRD